MKIIEDNGIRRASRQRLFFERKELKEENRTLADCNIQNESTILVVGELCAGAG
jgi:hypothetical protein